MCRPAISLTIRLFPHFDFLHGLKTWTFPPQLSSNTTVAFCLPSSRQLELWVTARQSKKSKGNDQAQTPDRKLCHGQKNGWVYWLSCLGQGFTTKASFLRLMYKLTLAHFHSSLPNLGLEFKSLNVSRSHSKRLTSESRNIRSQNVSISQRKSVVSRSRKVSLLPFATP